jgi:dTDP-4-amino-4,6-dideoxygalactose transaminase
MTVNIRRNDIEELKNIGLTFKESWMVVDHFEKTVAKYFWAPYAVAVDSCSHGIELCLRLLPRVADPVKIPAHTYMSVPMTMEILNIPYVLTDEQWSESYTLDPYNVVDAATMWSPDAYQAKT